MSAGHVTPKPVYYGIFGALMVLTAVTIAVSFVPLGVANFPVAITIAVFKASLVVLFFMHVKYSSRLTKAVVGMAFFFLGIMLLLTLTDYMSRGWFTSPQGNAGAGTQPTLSSPSGGAAPPPAAAEH